MGGFAHGTSGIALSLLALAQASGNMQYHQAALEALKYDRSLFRPQDKNWADLRTFPSLLKQIRPGQQETLKDQA